MKEKSESSLASNKERLKRIQINMDIENATERIIDIWQQCVTLRTELCLEDLLKTEDGKKFWMREITSKLKP